MPSKSTSPHDARQHAGNRGHQQSASTEQPDTVTSLNQDAFRAFDAMSRSTLTRFVEFNEGTGEFVTKRMKENFDFPGALMKCKTPLDVFNVYAGYFQCTMEQYVNEGQRVTATGTSLFSDVTKSRQDSEEAVH